MLCSQGGFKRNDEDRGVNKVKSVREEEIRANDGNRNNEERQEYLGED